MKYKIDVARIRENSIVLNGWVIGGNPEARAEFEVLDGSQKPVEFKYVPVRRDDVSQNYFKTTYDRDFGFDIRIPYVREKNEDRFLVIRCERKDRPGEAECGYYRETQQQRPQEERQVQEHDE